MIRVDLPTLAARAALDGLLARQFDAPPRGVVWQLDGKSVELPLDAYQLEHALNAERRALAADLQAHLPRSLDDVGPEPQANAEHKTLVLRVEGLTELIRSLPLSDPGSSLRIAS